jgi:hypothetical protein
MTAWTWRNAVADAILDNAVRVDFSYIARQQRMWAKETYPYAAHAAVRATEFEWVGASTHSAPRNVRLPVIGEVPLYETAPDSLRFTRDLMERHDALVALVKRLTADAATAQMNVAQRLGSIEKFYIESAGLHAALFRSGGVPKLNLKLSNTLPRVDSATPLGAAGTPVPPHQVVPADRAAAPTQQHLNETWTLYTTMRELLTGAVVSAKEHLAATAEEGKKLALRFLEMGIQAIEGVGQVELEFPEHAAHDAAVWRLIRFDAQEMKIRYDMLAKDGTDVAQILASGDPTGPRIILDQRPGLPGPGIVNPPWGGPAGNNYRACIPDQLASADQLYLLASAGNSLMADAGPRYRSYLTAVASLVATIVSTLKLGIDTIKDLTSGQKFVAWLIDLVQDLGTSSVQITTALFAVDQTRNALLETVNNHLGLIDDQMTFARQFFQNGGTPGSWPNPTKRTGFPRLGDDEGGVRMILTLPVFDGSTPLKPNSAPQRRSR